MRMDPRKLVPLGRAYQVHYLDELGNEEFKDVKIISKHGKHHSMNRYALVCLSDLCLEMFNEIYLSPLANSDEYVWITTEMEEDEIELMVNFFEHGLLPKEPTDSEVDLSYSSLFQSFGLKLGGMNHSAETKGEDFKFYPDTVVKEEVSYDLDNLSDAAEPIDEPMEDPIPPKMSKIKRASFKEREEDESDPDFGSASEKKKKKKKKENNKMRKKYERKIPYNYANLWWQSGNVDEGEELFKFPQDKPRNLSLLYQCAKCVRGFPTLVTYRQHFIRHELNTEDKNKAFVCLRCLEFHDGRYNEIQEHMKNECKAPRFNDRNSPFKYLCFHCQEPETIDEHKDFVRHLKKYHPMIWAPHFSSNICTSCGKKWASSGALKKHIGIEGPYHLDECTHCGEGMEDWHQYQAHLDQEHHGVFLYRCGLCGEATFHTREEERQHRRVCKHVKASSKDPNCDFSCTYCGVEITTTLVRQHLLTKHEDLKVHCSFCKLFYFSEEELKVHVNHLHKNAQDPRYVCKPCDKKFSSPSNYELHMLTQHMPKEDRPFKCPKCELRFVKEKFLKNHLRVHDEFRPDLINQKRKTCEKCGVSVYEKCYEKHYANFHGNLHIQCEKCDKTFKCQSSYRRHFQRVHTLTNCKDCGEEMNPLHLRRHKYTRHTAEVDKPYVCRVCDPPKGFITITTYREHNNIHTGERPYNCDFCSNTFKNSSNKFKHMRESHRGLYKPGRKAHKREMPL